jgi:hypothetical protein
VPCPDEAPRSRPDASFAALMKRSFGLDVLACPRCGATMRFTAVLLDRREVRRLLEHLQLWTAPLPLHPPRGPPDEHDALDFA